MTPDVTLTRDSDLDESAVLGVEVTDGMVDGVAAFCAQSGDDTALQGRFLFLYSKSLLLTYRCGHSPFDRPPGV